MDYDEILESNENFHKVSLSLKWLPDESLSLKWLPDEYLSQNGLPDESLSQNGLPDESLSQNGLPEESLSLKWLPDESLSLKWLPDESLSQNGLPDELLSQNGLPVKSWSRSGLPDDIVESKWTTRWNIESEVTAWKIFEWEVTTRWNLRVVVDSQRRCAVAVSYRGGAQMEQRNDVPSCWKERGCYQAVLSLMNTWMRWCQHEGLPWREDRYGIGICCMDRIGKVW